MTDADARGSVGQGPQPELRAMVAADFEPVAATLGRAFDDDPVWQHVIGDGDGPDRARRIGTIMAVLARSHLKHEVTWVTGPTDSRAECAPVSAVGVWAPPGHWRTPLRVYLRDAPLLLRNLGIRNVRHVATLAHVEKFHPRQPHYYLAILGTDPSAQGRGLGSRLVRRCTDRADLEGLGCYLESSKLSNVPFYERHGFRVTDEIRIPGGGPLVYGMWRDPQVPDDPA